MKKVIALLTRLLFIGIINRATAQQQKPRLDTVDNKVILIDVDGAKYNVLRSDKSNRSYIVKTKPDGTEYKVFLFRKPENE